MKGLVFTDGSPYQSAYGITGEAIFTPLFMEKDGRKYPILNAVKMISGDSPEWIGYCNEANLKEIAFAKEELIENGGKYFTLYSRYKDPIEFLDWVKEKGYTFEVWGELFRESKPQNGVEQYTDFHGNLVEYSAAFYYRIYDAILLDKVKTIVSELPRHYHYTREQEN
jgi:hypothetical protein